MTMCGKQLTTSTLPADDVGGKVSRLGAFKLSMTCPNRDISNAKRKRVPGSRAHPFRHSSDTTGSRHLAGYRSTKRVHATDYACDHFDLPVWMPPEDILLSVKGFAVRQERY
jgi:hypothetical protein